MARLTERTLLPNPGMQTTAWLWIAWSPGSMPAIGNGSFNDTRGCVCGVGDSSASRFITESSDRMAAHTGPKTWNRSA
jgi:hypothetical protein